MNDQERIHKLREMAESSSVVFEDAYNFILGLFSSTPGREKILREMDGYKKYFEDNFTPDLINPEETWLNKRNKS